MKRKEGSIRASVRECRIGVAVGIGLFFGIVCSLYFPHGFFFSGSRYPSSSSETFSTKISLVHPLPKENGLPCESTEKVKLLKSELNNLREEIEHLKKQEAELNSKLKISEQQKEAAQKQVLALGPSVKSGPVGTVKSLRTNPPVLPDESANPTLAELLSKIAINKEVIVGISNNNVRGMLKVWFESIKKLGITNFLVVALDDPIAEFCRQNGVPVYRRDATVSAVQADTGANHAISGLKFHLLREFLVLGYGVLLSDVDIVYLQNPFHHLHRDCDVEAMSDGFTNQTAYGYDDVFDDQKMGWSRYAHTMRVFVFNSGFFYIRPTIPSIELLDRVTTRLSKEKAWDQAVFNEELYFPSRPGYEGLHASRRAMDFYLFMNSKVLFTIVRKNDIYANFKPVVIHVNYHPDKYERMLAIVDRYNGNKDALKRFPDGSEW